MLELFDRTECELGEGVFFDPLNRRVFWLDINNNTIMWKSILSENEYKHVIILKYTPSVIFDVKNNEITLLDAKGVLVLDIDNEETQRIINIPHNFKLFRGNDGVKLTDGTLLFGSMERTPRAKTGCIYHFINKSLKIIDNIGIPNLFIELDDMILISDSFEQKVYSYNKIDFKVKRLWADFSDMSMTPDGGCLSNKGTILIAFWDGSCLIEFNQVGNIINKIDLPVKRPTNCSFINQSDLIVVSAREGLSAAEIAEYPDSGKTFKVSV